MRRRGLAWSCALLLAGVGCKGDETPEGVGQGRSSAQVTPRSLAGEPATSGSAADDRTTRGAERQPIPPDAPPPGPIPPEQVGAGAAVRDVGEPEPRPDGDTARRAADDTPPANLGGVALGGVTQVDRAESITVAAPIIEPTSTTVPVGDGTIGLARPGTLGAGAPADAPGAYGAGLAEAGDDRPSYGSSRGRLGPVPGALGLSPTIQLYTFRADLEQGLAAHPRQCRPEYILETIVAVVNRAGGPCEAQRNRIPQAAVDLAYVMCHMPDDVPGCERTYIGTLWVERTPGTHHDYELQGFGRVARICGSRVEAVTGTTDRRFAGRGRALGRLFDLCGQRLTGDATSTSASSSPYVEPR